MTSGHSHVDIPSEARNLYDRLSSIQDAGVKALVLQLFGMEEQNLGACVQRINDREAGLSIKELGIQMESEANLKADLETMK